MRYTITWPDRAIRWCRSIFTVVIVTHGQVRQSLTFSPCTLSPITGDSVVQAAIALVGWSRQPQTYRFDRRSSFICATAVVDLIVELQGRDPCSPLCWRDSESFLRLFLRELWSDQLNKRPLVSLQFNLAWASEMLPSYKWRHSHRYDSFHCLKWIHCSSCSCFELTLQTLHYGNSFHSLMGPNDVKYNRLNDAVIKPCQLWNPGTAFVNFDFLQFQNSTENPDEPHCSLFNLQTLNDKRWFIFQT